MAHPKALLVHGSLVGTSIWPTAVMAIYRRTVHSQQLIYSNSPLSLDLGFSHYYFHISIISLLSSYLTQ